ncbi:MAG TPA: 2-hydroxyacyl-CoA dehydratase [Pyrinomonadaceae bacterium]|jgi:benzoyl-CoA reductase subunit C|nr:2-hydroxyacyl-CoA dehydratase [Pyrinomonadaceae bacterium]
MQNTAKSSMPFSVSSVVNRSCEDIIQDLNFSTVKLWKEPHPAGKAIGYFPVYAPVEIIHACGMLPVGLNGAGDQLDIQYADARFGSFICSIIKTTLEMGLTNHLAAFDGLLFSSICDSARNLCFVMKRNFPDLYTDFLHLPHNPNSEASAAFLVTEYERLIRSLEQMGGIRLTDRALLDSIEAYNENRRLTRQLYDERAVNPHLIRTSKLYALIRAGNFLPVEEHTALLRKTVHELPKRTGKQRDSIRIVVEGSFCEQPPLDLIKIIEEAGCYIVDDDFVLGPRWFLKDVPLTNHPLKSLAESYIDRSVYSSVRHDWRKPRHKQLIQKVRTRKADAALLLIAKFCEPAYFDYVLFKQELEKEGIPHLLMEFEEKMFTFERLRTEIETFVESLLFD